MREPAYIAIAGDGYVTLFWGDGTEEQKTVIARGRRPAHGRDLIAAIEELKIWAEESGYEVIVPAYDLDAAEDVDIVISPDEAETIDLNEVDSLLDDLFFAGNYPEEDMGYDT